MSFALEAQTQKNVIMYIGDGFGIAPKTATRMALGQGTEGKRYTSDPGFQILALDKLKYQATVTTHSLNSWITDSGPGASVYAGGKDGKIDNEAISYSVKDSKSIETILEAAKKQGYAVGLVTTTRVTHATPAAFGSHIWFRDLEDYIASQYISKDTAEYRNIYRSTTNGYVPARDWDFPLPKYNVEIDVILGGGVRHFFPTGVSDTLKDKAGLPILVKGIPYKFAGKRADGANLIKIAKNRGYKYVNSRDALMNLDISQFTTANSAKLIGLFNASHDSYEQDRQQYFNWEPSLPDMVEIAVKVLKAKGGAKGFFLLVEGGRIDHLSHANSGGISVVGTSYTVDSDKEAYLNADGTPNGEGTYLAKDTTKRNTGIYGSDYMIKEVLAYDYAIAEGRKLLTENSKTLLFSSSDHECGGTGVVALHDEADLQGNFTKIRTYASGPRQNGTNAGSGGGPSKSDAVTKKPVAEFTAPTTYATPTNIQRGDVDFATTSVSGWFPDYITYPYEGRNWPKPSSATARRIVISYASNPLTNGNGVKAGGTPGNHTPQDVLVNAEDNTGGSHASQITGQGQLDNTYLTHIMSDFLGLTTFLTGGASTSFREDVSVSFNSNVYPNPMTETTYVDFTLVQGSKVTVDLVNESGLVVKKISDSNFPAGGSTVSFKTTGLSTGIYFVVVKSNNETLTKRAVKI